MNTTFHERRPEGDCILRVGTVTQADDQLEWSFVVDRGRCRGTQVGYNTPLAKDRLWSLRNLVETLGG